MALVEAAFTLVFVFLLPPFAIILIAVLLSASIGKSLGLREKYVQSLIKVFEFGKTRLSAQRRVSNASPSDSDTESSEEEQLLPLHEEDEEDEDQGSGNEVISREVVLRPRLSKVSMSLSGTEDFKLWDPLYYVRTGVEAIVDDEVTKRFSAEELPSWNLLTRTNCRYQFVSVRLTVFWAVGVLVRYGLLLPIRIAILIVGTGFLVFCTYLVGCLPDSPFKKQCNYSVTAYCFDVLSGALSLVAKYHNRQNMPRNGICVANHTSPVDALVLAADNTYDLVGQRHGGFLGLLQRALSRASSHIWFERSEAKDRFAVAKRLREHVEDPDKLPILIFPEGTCINNTSVMQFKKGTFEVGGTIYPVAIKYDPRFGDAFWNSSEFGMMSYIMMMMTSWAIVCDVWYLPPMVIKEGETSIDFANRVKAEIARQGGLVDLIWDGGLKRTAPKKEWREQYQQEFSRRLRLHSLSSMKARASGISSPVVTSSTSTNTPACTVSSTTNTASNTTNNAVNTNSNNSVNSSSNTKPGYVLNTSTNNDVESMNVFNSILNNAFDGSVDDVKLDSDELDTNSRIVMEPAMKITHLVKSVSSSEITTSADGDAATLLNGGSQQASLPSRVKVE